jgi:acyl carrier protein
MSREEIQKKVLIILGGIAPEADLPALKLDVSLRDQLDIDSMDLLNFVIALHKEFKVNIPEKDYPKFATLKGCVEQLAAAGSG